MAAPLNGNGFDDDDFEDFGGFEAAEPVTMPQQVNPAAQAAPNVWAAMFVPSVQGTSNVQPDLLCGQNRFPQHLDNPLTLDVAGSAQACIPPVDMVAPEGSMAGAGILHDLGGLPDTDEIDLENINLANEILDGSFRSASTNQSGASFQSHGFEQLPDISGLDIAARIVNNISVPRVDTGNVNSASIDNQTVPSPSFQADSDSVASPKLSDRANPMPVAVQNATYEILRNELANEKACERSAEDSLLQRANGEKETVLKELEKQLSENSRLTDDLARAHELAAAAKQSYDELQAKHDEQIEELRRAGHETLTVIVEEYKSLLNSTLEQQQEVWEQRLTERLKEETEKLRETLTAQKEEFDCLQIEERKKNEEKLQEVVQEMKLKQKDEFSVLLATESTNCEHKVSEEIQKEKAAAGRQLTDVIADEQRKAKDMLEQEQETFRKQLASEMAKQRNEMKTALKQQKENYQGQFNEGLREERILTKESMQQVAQCARDDMNTYLQQQREADRSVQRRQLASLDLFLESARHQLTLLMDGSSDREKDTSTDMDGSSDREKDTSTDMDGSSDRQKDTSTDKS